MHVTYIIKEISYVPKEIVHKSRHSQGLFRYEKCGITKLIKTWSGAKQVLAVILIAYVCMCAYVKVRSREEILIQVIYLHAF